jgi:hypothetical protein
MDHVQRSISVDRCDGNDGEALRSSSLASFRCELRSLRPLRDRLWYPGLLLAAKRGKKNPSLFDDDGGVIDAGGRPRLVPTTLKRLPPMKPPRPATSITRSRSSPPARRQTFGTG